MVPTIYVKKKNKEYVHLLMCAYVCVTSLLVYASFISLNIHNKFNNAASCFLQVGNG